MTTDSSADSPARQTSRRVMVVEDHDAVREIVCIFLSDCGYQVVGCGSGTEALARLDETQPELILMDLRMPVLDGYETTVRIRQQSRWDNVPIVAYSCEADEDSHAVLKVLGFDGWLVKPAPLEQIGAVVARFLDSAGNNCAA